MIICNDISISIKNKYIEDITYQHLGRIPLRTRTIQVREQMASCEQPHPFDQKVTPSKMGKEDIGSVSDLLDDSRR
jgi:hypothetical protein